jgi:hypothetical protein
VIPLKESEPYKSFIYKPLDSKTRFIALSGRMVTGPFSEGSGARRCPGSGRLPIARVWATHPNPAWRPKQPSFWPAVPPNRHRTALRAAPHPPRSLAVVPLIRIRGTTARLRGGYGGMSRRQATLSTETARNQNRLKKRCKHRGFHDPHRVLAGVCPGCLRDIAVGARGVPVRRWQNPVPKPDPRRILLP